MGVRVWPKLGLYCGMARGARIKRSYIKKMLCDAKNFSVGEASPEGSPRRLCGQDYPPPIIIIHHYYTRCELTSTGHMSDASMMIIVIYCTKLITN